MKSDKRGSRRYKTVIKHRKRRKHYFYDWINIFKLDPLRAEDYMKRIDFDGNMDQFIEYIENRHKIMLETPKRPQCPCCSKARSNLGKTLQEIKNELTYKESLREFDNT